MVVVKGFWTSDRTRTADQDERLLCLRELDQVGNGLLSKW
jgi:hypothetical protein